MRVLDLVLLSLLLGLASDGLRRVWFGGSIFSDLRDWMRAVADSRHLQEGQPNTSARAYALAGELLTCEFCFTAQASLWLSLITSIGFGSLGWFPILALSAFCVARLSAPLGS